jgi:arylsulfatase A-like enzyme
MLAVMVSRRNFLGAAATVPAVLARAATSGRPPNLLFVLTDDQRYDTLGCMGNRIIRTPNVDRLARSGVVFDNNFVTTSICMVSRASIFTGLYMRSHSILDFATPLMAEDRPNTYYNLLRKAGYRTGFIGKYGVGNDMPVNDFDYWRGFPGQGKFENKQDGKIVHLHEIQTEQSLGFVDTCKADQPFCLSISTKAPHADDPEARQYIPEPDLMEMYKDDRIPHPPLFDPEHFEKLPSFLKTTEMRKRWGWRFTSEEQYQTMVKNYYRLITGVDRMVGRTLERLQSRGLLENTVVVYTSDNGYFLGERGMADKWMMYEPSIRTPLVIWDGRRPNAKASRRREMTLNIDIAPTLLDYAGLSSPVHVQGRSLKPLVEDGRWQPRREWFYEHHFSTSAAHIPRCEGVRTEDWKYIRYLDASPEHEELYNLRRDPNETMNLVQKAPAQAEKLRERRRQWLAAFDAWQRGNPWREPAA